MATRPPRLRDLIATLTALLGVLLQIVQNEDERFPFVYFTILSALLVVLAASAFAVRWSRLGDPLSHCAQAGVLVSALVFWAVIAPGNGLGEGLTTQAANVTLHVAVPLAVVWQAAERLAQRPVGVRSRLLSLWFPSAYLAVLLCAQAFGARAPYAFLDLSTQSKWAVLSVTALVGLAYVGSGLLLDLAVRGRPSLGRRRVDRR